MRINQIILHHSAVSREKNSNQYVAIDNYHKSKGWGMIGYHYLIEPKGEIRKGRDEGMEGAHTIGHNHDSIGICLTGNFDIELPTEEQKISLRKLLLELKGRYPVAEIAYHRKFASYKSCPGKLIPDNWAKNLINTMKSNAVLIQNKKEVIIGLPCQSEEALIDKAKNVGIELPLSNGKIDWTKIKFDYSIK